MEEGSSFQKSIESLPYTQNILLGFYSFFNKSGLNRLVRS